MPTTPVQVRHPTRNQPLLAGLIAGLVVVVGIAIAVAYLAEEYHSRLEGIPSCYGGLENGICQKILPPELGLAVNQLRNGTHANGTYAYTFLLTPEPPPVLSASNISFRVYNGSTGTVLSLANASLLYPNGTPFAFYSTSNGNCTTTSSRVISEVSLLTLSSPSNLAGERLALWTSLSKQIVEYPIS